MSDTNVNTIVAKKGLQITSTKYVGKKSKIKGVIYGRSGAGKTVLCSTAPNPLIISAEAGLMSLADKDVPVIEIKKFSDLAKAYKLAISEPGIETICLDSISDVAEVVLAEYKTEEKDPRKAYGRMAEDVIQFVKTFREMDKHIFIVAKEEANKDESTGKITYVPSAPGRVFAVQIPYLMDLVLCLRINKGGERYLQTQPDLYYDAKDRSGKLARKEKPDLTHIINTIKGE